MFRKKHTRILLLVIAVFAILSMACGLLDRALDALSESETLEQVISVTDMLGEESLDLSPYEAAGAEFLFEIDPFDDVIRWRFYTVEADLLDVGEYYLSQLPVYLVEKDQVLNGERYLVLNADHPLSGIYTRDELDGLESGYEMMESTLLDVEVLHSTAHDQTGRLGISGAMDLLPSPVPADTPLVILVYNHSSTGVGGIIDAVPGVIPDLDQNGIVDDPDELLNGGDAEQVDDEGLDEFMEDDEGLDEFMEDDETQEVADLSGVCSQVLGSGDCYHPYLPVVEGYTRSYQTEGGITTETVTAVRADGFTVVTETADGDTISAEFECTPDGVAGGNFDDSIMETLEGAPSDLAVDIDIEGTQLPNEISAGDSWQALVTVTISMQAAGAESKNVVQIELDYTAVGEEVITTPGGRFRAMRIDYTSNGENTLVMGTFSQTIFTLQGSGSEWYVECLGKVRSVAYASWTGIASVESETRMELMDFGIQ